MLLLLRRKLKSRGLGVLHRVGLGLKLGLGAGLTSSLVPVIADRVDVLDLVLNLDCRPEMDGWETVL